MLNTLELECERILLKYMKVYFWWSKRLLFFRLWNILYAFLLQQLNTQSNVLPFSDYLD